MIIGFVTCQEELLTSHFPTVAEPDFISPEPQFAPDDYIAVQDLREHGHIVRPIVWGTHPAHLLDFDLVIVRSPWDYMDSPAKKQHFFNWISELDGDDIPVVNPPALMHWLLDKHYLQDFAALGTHVIPSIYYHAGTKLNLGELFTLHGTFVLKQCISAGGAGLFFIDNMATATQKQSALDQQILTADYMLQPFIPEISTHGEWSLIFLGGKYSHAILKKPAAHAMLVHAEYGGTLHFPVTPPASVKEFANEVYLQLLPALLRATGISLMSSSILYMRIDVIETANGPVLVECEGVEPELFFRAQAGSEALFREAIEEMITLDG